MLSLLVPIPLLKFEAPNGSLPNLAVLEKPLEIRCSIFQFSNGKPFEQKDQKVAGFFIYRRQITNFVEIWDETMKQWIPDMGETIAELKPIPFAFKSEDRVQPWLGLLVPVAKKDRIDRQQFEKVGSSGFPEYFFRAYFISNDHNGSIAGLSAPSSIVRFTNVLDAILAGIRMGEGETVANASKIELFLRNTNFQTIGSVVISSLNGTSTTVEISNFDGFGSQQGVIRLKSDGDIEIQPAAGRKVKILGQMETQQISYLPSPGGIRKDLI